MHNIRGNYICIIFYNNILHYIHILYSNLISHTIYNPHFWSVRCSLCCRCPAAADCPALLRATTRARALWGWGERWVDVFFLINLRLLSLCTLWISMVYLWYIFDHLWYIYAISMVYVWYVYGICMVCVWDMVDVMGWNVMGWNGIYIYISTNIFQCIWKWVYRYTVYPSYGRIFGIHWNWWFSPNFQTNPCILRYIW